MSDDDNIFAATWRDSGGNNKGYVAVRVSDVSVLIANTVASNNVDEVHISNDGKYIYAIYASPIGTGASAINATVVKVADNTKVDLTDGTPDFTGTHAGYFGTDLTIGEDNWEGSLRKRSMSTPHSWTTLINQNFVPYNTLVSCLATDTSYAVVENVRGRNLAITAMGNEIFQIATDGSGGVKRWFDHHSFWNTTDTDTYYWIPRSNISRDGQFVAFTSNWGTRNGRNDLYIAKLPIAPSTAGQTVLTGGKGSSSRSFTYKDYKNVLAALAEERKAKAAKQR